MFKRHPVALPFFFLTEMWERFGYYLMIGIFTLYMTDAKNGGLELDRSTATDIYGTFIALVYLTPFIGGLLADRLLGFRRSIVIGGVLMGIGYMLLSVPKNMPVFYFALFLIILGNGFFKPNISTLLGNLYNNDQYKDRKDEGYNIFYMGINVGALICNFVAAYLRNTYGWGYAFFAAGVGMLLGVVIFIIGWKKYAHAEAEKRVKDSAESKEGARTMLMMLGVMGLAAVTGYIGWILPGTLLDKDSTDAFVFAALPVIGFYIWILWRAKQEDKLFIKALLALYLVVIPFWAVFKQNGTALTTWAEYYTDRSIPASLEGTATFMGMVQHDTVRVASYPKYDAQFRVEKDKDDKVIKVQSYPPYLNNLQPERRPAENAPFRLLSTEIFQSVNPAFVIVLTPLVVFFFAFLARRKAEPGTPAKMFWGLLITALSSVVMVGAVIASHNGFEKASPWWIVASYGVVTLGELCISPMGLSTVSKLAPRHIAGLMMGGWQLATSLGNKLSGVLATMWDGYADKTDFFWVNCALLGASALLLLAILKWLNSIFRSKGLI